MKPTRRGHGAGGRAGPGAQARRHHAATTRTSAASSPGRSTRGTSRSYGAGGRDRLPRARRHERHQAPTRRHLPELAGRERQRSTRASSPTSTSSGAAATYFFDIELKPRGILQPMRLDPQLMTAAFPQPALAGVALYEKTTDASGTPTPKWVGVVPERVRHRLQPRRLPLARPARADAVARPHRPAPRRPALPGRPDAQRLGRRRVHGRPPAPDGRRRGGALRAAARTGQAARSPSSAKDRAYNDAIAAGWKRGMGELLLIAANGRYFTDSSPQVPNDVGNGDAAAGICDRLLRAGVRGGRRAGAVPDRHARRRDGDHARPGRRSSQACAATRSNWRRGSWSSC